MAPTGMQGKASKSNKRPLYLVTCCVQCNVMKPRFSSVTVAFLRRKLVIEAQRLKQSTAQAILSLYPCGHDNFKGQASMWIQTIWNSWRTQQSDASRIALERGALQSSIPYTRLIGVVSQKLLKTYIKNNSSSSLETRLI